MKKIIFAVVGIWTLSAQAAIELKSVANAGKIQFEAVGRPSMVKIKGTATGPEGGFTINKGLLSGEMKFALNSLDTGIDLRNDHMKEKYLEVNKYPHAKLTVKDLPLPSTWSLQNAGLKDFPFKGILQLHGVEKEVSGTLNVSEKLKTEAQFEIKISDFKIDIPSYLGITVADTVKVQVSVNEFTAQEK